MLRLRSGPLPASTWRPSLRKSTKEGSAPAAMVRSIVPVVNDTRAMDRSCAPATAAWRVVPSSLVKSWKESGGEERRMRRPGRKVSMGISTSEAGSRESTQRASLRGEICMATAWFPVLARRLILIGMPSISYTVPASGARTKTFVSLGCGRTVAGAASSAICFRTWNRLRSTTATERLTWLATKQ